VFTTKDDDARHVFDTTPQAIACARTLVTEATTPRG
jgi:SulP family sulfate permease